MKINTVSQMPEDQRYWFEKFWSCIPPGHSKGKAEAVRAWMKLNPEPQLAEEIVEAYDAMWQHKISEKKVGFMPMAATFLNQRRFEDDIPRPNKSKAPVGDVPCRLCGQINDHIIRPVEAGGPICGECYPITNPVVAKKLNEHRPVQLEGENNEQFIKRCRDLIKATSIGRSLGIADTRGMEVSAGPRPAGEVREGNEAGEDHLEEGGVRVAPDALAGSDTDLDDFGRYIRAGSSN